MNETDKEKLGQKLKNMWAKVMGHETYIFHNGKVIYKSWRNQHGNKTQPSVLFNEHWPNVEIQWTKSLPQDGKEIK